MIQLRKNPLSEESINISFTEGENGKDLVDRVLKDNGYELTPELLGYYQLLINGKIVDRDLWSFVEIKESDAVLVAPRLLRGSGGQIFKQVAMIAITAAAAYYLGPAGANLSGAAFGAAVAGVSVATGLALNALIPPPGLGSIGSLGASFEGSQMYTITGQSNSAKKVGYVPRVYGTHRMFPVIAANPYTELETRDGNLVQYYYGIYDFGFGPLDISDIRIGDTSITDYADAEYRLVDLNKPAVSEGYWDDRLHDSFTLYKGDVERDGSSVALDKNQNDPGASVSAPPREALGWNNDTTVTVLKPNDSYSSATQDLRVGMFVTGPFADGTFITAISGDDITLSSPVTGLQRVNEGGLLVVITNWPIGFYTSETYQTVRNASNKIEDSDQEITLEFVSPQGLTSYATNGKQAARNIELKIEFADANAPLGTETWRGFNELDYVSEFEIDGGNTAITTANPTLPPIKKDASDSDMTLISQSKEIPLYNLEGSYTGSNPINYDDRSDETPSGPYNPPSTPGATITKIAMATYITKSYGYAKGATKIALKTGEAKVRDSLYFKGNFIGIVDGEEVCSIPGYTFYKLKEPLKTSIALFEARYRYARAEWYGIFGNTGYTAKYLYDIRWSTDPSLTNKILAKFPTSGVAVLTANTTNPVYFSVKFKPLGRIQYKVRITRVKSTSAYTYKVVDKLTLSALSTRFDRNPILTNQRHVFLEVRIKATNQLNGSISNLSAITESILDVWDSNTSSWVKEKTNNPAWIFADLLTGTVNKKAVPKSRLHIPSLVEWANFCDEVPTAPTNQSYTLSRFTSNFILDFDTTLQSLINNVANAAQASLNIIDGKYGVLIDKLKTTPVQIFTPRNSWGFNSSRIYTETPHALKVRYIDPNKDWQISEVVVYDDGYTEETATEFQEISTFACTNNEQAWRFGRYMIAQSRLRKENITIQVDFEHLVCTRGDYVQITQDVMKVGGRPARVKTVAGNLITIDDAIDTSGLVSYGYVYRNSVTGIKTSTLTVVDSDQFTLNGDIPSVGDLIIIGPVGSIVLDCLVKSISPDSDLSATIELVEKADAIYSAESTSLIPDYNPGLQITVADKFVTPTVVRNLKLISNSWRVVGESYEYYIEVDWDAPRGSAYETFEVYVDSGKGFNLTTFTKESFLRYVVSEENLGVLHRFKILAVSSTGLKINLISAPTVSATPVKKTTAPSNINALYLNITTESLQLNWTPISDVDLAEYIIRYTPEVINPTWEASIFLMKADKRSTSATTQGRTGSYFIKAVDYNGNRSVNTAQARTTIPNLFNLNIISETNDFPLLEGYREETEVSVGDTLILKAVFNGGVTDNEYPSEGYYYYNQLLDLGEIYTVRLQSQVRAEGFTVEDLMSNWETLESLEYMTMANEDDWDVEAQWRATESYNVMAEWSNLELIDPISEGSQENWSQWRSVLTIGDATGRVFQFRLKLSSYKASVTPRVFDGIIKADMPDRFETYNNLIAPPAGLEVVYSPAFKGPGNTPNIQITQDDADSGDYFSLEDKTLNGFKITFYDISNNPVSRQFDVAVKGYGRKTLAVI